MFAICYLILCAQDVRLYIVGVQDPKSAKVPTRTTSIIKWRKDSRYTKSAQIATRTTSVNMYVIKRSNVHSPLSPSWLHTNSWTCAQDIRLHIVCIQEQKRAQLATRTTSIIKWTVT